MKKTVLRAYARLIAEVGARVQKGQDVVIEAELDQPEFVTMVADACYHAGARKVTVTWKHQALEKLAIRRESVRTLQTVEDWERAKLQHYVDTLPCRIYLLSEDPDGLRGVSPAKMASARQGRYSVIKPYRDQMEGHYQWCIAAVPGVAWAKKVFPNETKSRAVEKLWEAILYTCRVHDDPVAAWDAHNADLQARCDYLNSLGIKTLEYRASNGTHLTVGMIPEAQFCGGGEYTIGGSYFNPNLPTEECFISPKRGEAEGIVYSSKPLSYQGQLIEDFSIRFAHCHTGRSGWNIHIAFAAVWCARHIKAADHKGIFCFIVRICQKNFFPHPSFFGGSIYLIGNLYRISGNFYCLAHVIGNYLFFLGKSIGLIDSDAPSFPWIHGHTVFQR